MRIGIGYDIHRFQEGVLFYRGDHELGEVEDALQAAGRNVQEETDAAWRPLNEPDVSHRRSEINVAHPLTPHLGAGHLHAALVADDALVAHPLVLAAIALEVLGGTKDLLAEQAVFLGFQGPVVDRLRLGDLTVGPGADLFRRGKGYAQGVEIVDLKSQGNPLPSRSRSCRFRAPGSPRRTFPPGSPAPLLRSVPPPPVPGSATPSPAP